MLKSQNIYDMRGKIRLYGHFGIGPSLLRNRELSLGARAVYLYLSTYFRFRDIEDNMVWPNITQMAKELDIGRATIARYLKELKDHGFLKVEPVRVQREDRTIYASKVYFLKPDPEFSRPPMLKGPLKIVKRIRLRGDDTEDEGGTEEDQGANLSVAEKPVEP
ncbi:MAG: helix-turn-helix domain-containing protein [Bacillota bacterium]|jgi:hypothetical protein|nr:helix-turn-helix domain-containing protein [Bacillota bacterium]